MKKNISILEIIKFATKNFFNFKLLLYSLLLVFSFIFSFIFPFSFFLITFFSYKLKRTAMSIAKFDLPQPNEKLDFLNYTFLYFKKSILNLFCWYQKKLFLFFLLFSAFILFFLIFLLEYQTKISNFNDLIFILTLLGFSSFIYYLIIFFIHFIKTDFADYLFLSGLSPEQSAIRKSYEFVISNNLTKKLILLWSLFLFLFFVFFLAPLFFLLIIFVKELNIFLIFSSFIIFFVIFLVGFAIFQLSYAKLFKELIEVYYRGS
ncbi:MAG: hypothetical protein QXV44_00885 [Candidatus Anstonellaceae archaeon]